MATVFVNRTNLGSGEIVTFGDYKPWSWHKMEGGDSSNYPEYSGKILDLKEGKTQAVQYFAKHVEPELSGNFVIVTIPSHDPEKTGGGLALLAAELAKTNGRIDGSDALVRTTKIAKLAHGGDRSTQVHLDSLKVACPHVVKGRDVLLLDDVRRTGNSLVAARKLLLDAGARSVVCAALGRTG